MPFQEETAGGDDVSRNEHISTMLQELMNGNRGLELSIETRADEGENNLEDLHVDTCYGYEDYANELNLDSLNLDDPNEGNTCSFETMAADMTDLTPDGGVKKQVKRQGCGVAMPERSLVWLHYNMYLEREEVPFDSTYLRSSKNQFKLRLGEGQVIPGFEIAVASMANSEKSRFLIQPRYGFGSMGIPPRVPPNATILLEVDVLKTVSGDVECQEEEQEDLKVFKTAYRKAKVFHLKGNNFFQSNSFLGAADAYRKAVDLLTSCSMNSDEEEGKQIKLLLKLFRNLCVCYNKLNMPQRVCLAARDAVFADPVSTNFDAKLHFNWGKALAKLSNFSKAAEHLKKAQSLDPNCAPITAELVALEEERKKQLNHEKITYKRALGLGGPSPRPPPAQPGNSLSQVEKDEGLVIELEEFARSDRSRLELPSSITKEEKRCAQLMAEHLGLEYREIKRLSGETIVAICK